MELLLLIAWKRERAIENHSDGEDTHDDSTIMPTMTATPITLTTTSSRNHNSSSHSDDNT